MSVYSAMKQQNEGIGNRGVYIYIIIIPEYPSTVTHRFIFTNDDSGSSREYMNISSKEIHYWKHIDRNNFDSEFSERLFPPNIYIYIYKQMMLFQQQRSDKTVNAHSNMTETYWTTIY